MAIEKRIAQGFFAEFLNEGVYRIKGEDLRTPEQITTEHTEIDQVKEAIAVNGNSSSPTLLLLNYPQQKNIPEEDREYLAKILSAVKLSFEQIAWLNMVAGNFSYEEIEKLPHTIILAFGIGKNVLPKEVKNEELIEIGGKYFYSTEAAGKLKNNVAARKLFWEALQKIYKV